MITAKYIQAAVIVTKTKPKYEHHRALPDLSISQQCSEYRHSRCPHAYCKCKCHKQAATPEEKDAS